MTKTNVTFVRDFLGGLKSVTTLLLSELLFRTRPLAFLQLNVGCCEGGS